MSKCNLKNRYAAAAENKLSWLSKSSTVFTNRIIKLISLYILLIAVGTAGLCSSKVSAQTAVRPTTQEKEAKTKNKILAIPRLSADLPDGTLAWATIDQLHPLQPQTGQRAVKERRKKFQALLKEEGEEFSKKLFKKLRSQYVVPVVLGTTPEYDSRFGHLDALGYLTDRTHTTEALADLYLKVYGAESIYKPIYDEKKRPLNYVLVKVLKNKTKLSTEGLEKYLSQGNRSYLENWTRSYKGGARVREIDFNELPETVLETTDNPFRGFVSDMQDRELIPKNGEDFAQFRIAEEILGHRLATWDEVSEKPGSEQYEDAVERVAKYYRGLGRIKMCKNVYTK